MRVRIQIDGDVLGQVEVVREDMVVVPSTPGMQRRLANLASSTMMQAMRSFGVEMTVTELPVDE